MQARASRIICIKEGISLKGWTDRPRKRQRKYWWLKFVGSLRTWRCKRKRRRSNSKWIRCLRRRYDGACTTDNMVASTAARRGALHLLWNHRKCETGHNPTSTTHITSHSKPKTSKASAPSHKTLLSSQAHKQYISPPFAIAIYLSGNRKVPSRVWHK